MVAFDIETNDFIWKPVVYVLKAKSVFFVRDCLARTAEFWNCKASSGIPRKYDGGRFPSFLSQ